MWPNFWLLAAWISTAELGSFPLISQQSHDPCAFQTGFPWNARGGCDIEAATLVGDPPSLLSVPLSIKTDRTPTTPHHHGNRICCPQNFPESSLLQPPLLPAPYVAIPPDTIAQTKVAGPTRNHPPPPRQQILRTESALMGLETYKKRRNDSKRGSVL